MTSTFITKTWLEPRHQPNLIHETKSHRRKGPMLVRYLYHGRAPARPKLTAVAELMSAAKKPKPQPTAEDVEPSSTLEKAKNAIAGWDPRNGLGVYINKAETNPEGRVVEYDDDFVVIRDKFPKARYATSEAVSRARTTFNSS
jgi:hypothetical protein